MSAETRQTRPRIGRLVLAVSGLLSLLTLSEPRPILMHAVFVLAYFLRLRFPRPKMRFALAVLLSTWLLEFLAWLSSYVTHDPAPALFHPQLLPDMLIATGFYASWTVAWLLIMRRYRFSLVQVYIIQGVYGVLIEQSGAVFWMGLRQMPLGLLFWLYVFVAYGATMALAYRLASDQAEAQRDSWAKYPLAFVSLFVFSYAISFLWLTILDAMKVIPPPRPIWEHPFI